MAKDKHEEEIYWGKLKLICQGSDKQFTDFLKNLLYFIRTKVPVKVYHEKFWIRVKTVKEGFKILADLKSIQHEMNNNKMKELEAIIYIYRHRLKAKKGGKNDL